MATLPRYEASEMIEELEQEEYLKLYDSNMEEDGISLSLLCEYEVAVSDKEVKPAEEAISDLETIIEENEVEEIKKKEHIFGDYEFVIELDSQDVSKVFCENTAERPSEISNGEESEYKYIVEDGEIVNTNSSLKDLIPL